MRAGREVSLLLTVMCHLVRQLPNVQGRSRPQTCGCPVYQVAVVPDWSKFSRVQWYEVLNHPGPLNKCVVRKYNADNQTMKWMEQDGPYGEPTRVRKLDFVVEGVQQFLKKDKSFFQQILDTDVNTWALLHICSEGDKRSKFTLTLRDPLSVIPQDIMWRVSNTLEKARISSALRWTRSPCIVDRTLRQDPALSVPVIMYPSPVEGIPFDQSQSTPTTQQTDAQRATSGATEVPMLDDTTVPCESDLADETGLSRETSPPYLTNQAEEIGLPEEVVVLGERELRWYTDSPGDIGTSQKSSLPQETGTAPTSELSKQKSQSLEPHARRETSNAESPSDITTSSWIPYVNEDESW
ncbi:hypothetical protein HPB50_009051 [Hyalomma asiaticum]|uniref:Uncharacterized protein n=1 Tax=Hyalomma asiaticum TaxID=266040 RepID=A0ACB7SDP7_HYAAI|nr:hypothetical protein HPB50_009051 [Hyalomma asiaticum]